MGARDLSNREATKKYLTFLFLQEHKYYGRPQGHAPTKEMEKIYDPSGEIDEK